MIKTSSITQNLSIITDSYNRSFRKLRISLTNQCNFRCNYCVVPGNEVQPDLPYVVDSGDLIDYQQLLRIVKSIHEINPLETIKLTGGEPLLFHQLIPLIKELKLLGVDDISLTTNGQFLKHKIQDLVLAGIKSINVSLDAANEELFKKITGINAFNHVLEGIQHAIQFGIKVKLNTVVMRGVNSHQITPMINLAKQLNCRVRFLELMQMGYLYDNSRDLFFPEREILNEIKTYFDIIKLTRERGSTSNYWKTDHGVKFGIIANESEPFCGDCDRLRLDSSGKLYGCICSDKGISVLNSDSTPEIMKNKLHEALKQKQPLKFKGSPRTMKQIGG